MKTDRFQSCDHCSVFQIGWHIECSTLTASSFRNWNSSAGIPSPPLALFEVMFSKAHLTSHSRMSGSRSVITPSWLSGSWRSFSCTVLLCILPPLLNTNLLLLLGSYHFCPLLCPSLHETSLVAQTVKVSACNAGDPGSIPAWGSSPGEGNGNPLQYSYLENSMDGEAS